MIPTLVTAALVLKAAAAQTCTTTNHYDVQQGAGSCDALIPASHTCADSFDSATNSIGGGCNLMCEINNYDAQYGAGSCNYLIAVGAFDCATGQANGVACTVAPAQLADGTEPAAEGCCDFACDHCSQVSTTCDALPAMAGGSLPGTVANHNTPIDAMDSVSAPGACSAVIASGTETCAAIANGTSTVVSQGSGLCNLACQFNVLEALLEYAGQSMVSALLQGIAPHGASWLGITTATTNVYDDLHGAGQCDLLIASGWLCNGDFSLGGAVGFMGPGLASNPLTPGLVNTTGYCDVSCASTWGATTGATEAQVQAALLPAHTDSAGSAVKGVCQRAIEASVNRDSPTDGSLDGWICGTDLMGPSFFTTLAGDDPSTGSSYVPRMAGVGLCDFACANVQAAPPGSTFVRANLNDDLNTTTMILDTTVQAPSVCDGSNGCCSATLTAAPYGGDLACCSDWLQPDSNGGLVAMDGWTCGTLFAPGRPYAGQCDIACGYCSTIACPAGSTGLVSVGGVGGTSGTGGASGCTADAGYSGAVTATMDSPFFTSDLAAVACPTGSTGTVPGTSGTGGTSGCTTDDGHTGTVTATTVDPFYTSTLAPNCNDFTTEASVVDSSCSSCTSTAAADCAAATCAPGYDTYSAGVCMQIVCDDFTAEASVVDSSCTSCTGTAAADCAAATCASGYDTYSAGACTACTGSQVWSDSPPTCTDAADVTGAVTASLTLNTDFATIGSDTTATSYTDFVASFKIDVAALLTGVAASQVVVNSVVAGSSVVSFTVVPDSSGTAVTATALTAAVGSDGVSIAGGSTTASASFSTSSPTDCVGEWGTWGACSVTCGTGSKSQTYAITVAAANGGTACAATNGDTQTASCDAGTCPVDCVGEWGPWGTCSATCGGGTQSQTYAVSAAAVGSGTACSASAGDQQSQGCNTAACPVTAVDCVGDWGAWGACSVTCGAGTQDRTYTVTTTAAGTGTACSVAAGTAQSQACPSSPACAATTPAAPPPGSSGSPVPVSTATLTIVLATVVVALA